MAELMNNIKIIKYEGDNKTFIWKHPDEDFDTLSQLIVHESQEAIFFMNGQALDLFGPGRYTLETQNVPKLGKILNRTTGDKPPFHCEVYFINKTEQMSIKWGTDSRVQYIEPTYKFPLSIGASGEMTLRAEDSRKLLIKVVGTEHYLSQEKFVSFMRAFLMTKVKSYIAQTIKAEKLNIFEMDEKLESFSNVLRGMLVSDFSDYGIALERFFVMNISKPDGESMYEKFKSLHFRQYADVAEAKLRQEVGVIDEQAKAQKIVIESQAIATKRAQEGYTYQQERGFEVAERVAENDAVGQMTNLGVGLGTMAGVGGTIAGLVGNSMNQAMSGVTETTSVKAVAAVCTNCKNPLPLNAKFCLECGKAVPAAIPEGMVLCPKCKKIINKGKFCLECGYKFLTGCPKCGTDIPVGGKFCLECGEKLTEEK